MILEHERKLLDEMVMDLSVYAATNRRKWAYYDGEAGIKNIGIAVPQAMVDVEAIIGWPEIVVDALEERLDWQGWMSPEGLDTGGLDEVFRDNQLGTEVSKAILDALVTGVGFLEVSAGGEGEPAVIVDAVPPSQATFRWDARANRVAAGMVHKVGRDGERYQTLYLPDETITRVISREGDEEVTRVHHGRGRCGLVVLPNRTRSGEVRGKSELTKQIRYYTDHAIRTVLGMEYNREFYTTPQRWMANVEPEQLGLDEDSTPGDHLQVGWRVAMNKALIVPPNPEGDKATPTVGQFASAPPTPYIEQLRMLAQLVSAQSGIPATYLGFVSDNPPSADSIRMTENRLVKKAERRQAMFGEVLRNDLAYVCQSILDGAPADLAAISKLSVKWRDASTPTRAAASDSAAKLVGAGILPGRSSVVMDMIGLSPEEQSRVEADWARDTSRSLADALRSRVVPQDPVVDDVASRTRPVDDAPPEAVDADQLAKSFDALGKAIRSGVDPEDAARRLGLSGLRFTGAVPVSLRVPKEEVHDLEEK